MTARLTKSLASEIIETAEKLVIQAKHSQEGVSAGLNEICAEFNKFIFKLNNYL